MNTPPPELAQVFEEQSGRIFRTAYRITGSAQDAEDVLQNVFLRLARREADSLLDNADSYLYRAAINASLDVLRARKTRASVQYEELSTSEEMKSASVADTAQRLELSGWLQQALAKLSPRPAEMFILRYIDGYENNEIGEMLSTSAAVVAVTLHRVRGQLKKDYEAFQRGIHA